MILSDTIQILINKHENRLKTLIIRDVRIGAFTTAVQLSDGSVGVSSTLMPEDTEIHCAKENRDFGIFSPGKMTGETAYNLLTINKQSSWINTLKIAVLNAVSANHIQEPYYKIVPNTDPIDLLLTNVSQTVTLVGAFQSYIQRFKRLGNPLNVLEFNEQAFQHSDKKFYVPAAMYPEIVPQSDVLIITGLTLVNDTLDAILNVARPETKIIVTGPSVSFIPDAFFDKGVNIIGLTRITDAEQVLKVVSEGGAGYHLFRYGAEKVCVVNE